MALARALKTRWIGANPTLEEVLTRLHAPIHGSSQAKDLDK